MSLVNLSAQIKNVLTALQLAGSSAFVEVVEYPTNEFSGYPAASVTPSEVQSQFLTVADNQRGYGFMVELYYLVEQSTFAARFDTMRQLVDATLDAFDTSSDLAGTCDFLQAVPMEWTLQESSSGLVLAVAIHLVATKLIPIA